MITLRFLRSTVTNFSSIVNHWKLWKQYELKK